jgi:hypothetical protein
LEFGIIATGWVYKTGLRYCVKYSKALVFDDQLVSGNISCATGISMDISEAVCTSTLMLLSQSRVVVNVIWNPTGQSSSDMNSLEDNNC